MKWKGEKGTQNGPGTWYHYCIPDMVCIIVPVSWSHRFSLQSYFSLFFIYLDFLIPSVLPSSKLAVI